MESRVPAAITYVVSAGSAGSCAVFQKTLSCCYLPYFSHVDPPWKVSFLEPSGHQKSMKKRTSEKYAQKTLKNATRNDNIPKSFQKGSKKRVQKAANEPLLTLFCPLVATGGQNCAKGPHFVTILVACWSRFGSMFVPFWFPL